MDELGERRLEELLRQRPRIASLMASVDAGELDALGQMEHRLQQVYRELVSQGKPELADAVRGWWVARIGDVDRAEEYALREDDAPAPERWTGLRVRVSHVAGAGMTRPVQIVGHLAGVTERGLHVLTDDLEEDHPDRYRLSQAGSILRRVKAERLVAWASLLTVQPLPVREVFSMEANVRAHEDAVVDEHEAGDPPERL
ncbi:MAG: hypothetical protein M3Q49_07730 [Actinomycetota bacterium]|nr:hypothetical protein [Actinomycetota bacterium]